MRTISQFPAFTRFWFYLNFLVVFLLGGSLRGVVFRRVKYLPFFCDKIFYMAKLKGPLMSFSARGPLGRALAFSPWRGVPVARRFFTPKNPNSPAQVSARGDMSGGISLWRSTDFNFADSTAINLLGSLSKKTITGYNAFIRDGVNIKKTGFSPLAVHGFSVVAGAPVGLVWSDLGQQFVQTYIYSFASVGCGVVLAGTYPHGLILRSVDSGVSWVSLGQVVSDSSVFCLVSVGGGVVLAGTANHAKIFKSIDSGLTWVNLGQQFGEYSISALASVGGGVVLAGTSTHGYILRSVDSGSTWVNFGQQFGESDIRCFASVGGGVVLAGTYSHGLILRSVDSGLTWVNLGQQFGQIAIQSIVSVGGGVVLAGTYPHGLILRSVDSGLTWVNLGQQFSESIIYSLASVGGGVVLAGTYPHGLILRSVDSGLTWVNLGQQFLQSYIMVLAGTGGGVVLAGTGGGGKILRSAGGGFFVRFFLGDGYNPIDMLYGLKPRVLGSRVACSYSAVGGYYEVNLSALSVGIPYFAKFTARVGFDFVISGIYKFFLVA